MPFIVSIDKEVVGVFTNLEAVKREMTGVSDEYNIKYLRNYNEVHAVDELLWKKFLFEREGASAIPKRKGYLFLGMNRELLSDPYFEF